MTPREKLQAAIANLDLSLSADFMPMSVSRNRDAKFPTLNWRVTLKRRGRDVLTTDYSAGVAHCPSYSAPPRTEWDRSNSMWHESVTRWECESGFKAKVFTRFAGFSAGSKPAPILPDACDFIASLVLDSSVLDSGGFEQWASDCGYDSDSRKAFQTYQACVELAIKLRAAIGDAGMRALSEACQDY